MNTLFLFNNNSEIRILKDSYSFASLQNVHKRVLDVHIQFWYNKSMEYEPTEQDLIELTIHGMWIDLQDRLGEFS